MKERYLGRILVVDDEPDITTVFAIALRESGFEVEFYNDPLTALSNFKPSYYDLIILDIKMQQMNGFELYAEIQKVDNKVKVCFITAGEMYYDEVRKEKGGAEEQYCKLDTERFLQKPISNVDLVKGINKIMKTNKKPNIIL